MSDRNPSALRGVPKSSSVRRAPVVHAAMARPTAELVQLAVEARRRNGVWPCRADRPLDPYEMILLAQHEWRVGRVMHANALIEEAFLAFDTIEARADQGAVSAETPGARPTR